MKVLNDEIRKQCLEEGYRGRDYYGLAQHSCGPAGNYIFPLQPQYRVKASELEKAVDSDPITMIMGNKKELSLFKIELLSSQLYKRGQVHAENLERLESDELFCSNKVLQKESAMDYVGAVDIELNQLLRLRKEQREEKESYFRDTQRLNKDLIDEILEHKAMNQRKSLFDTLN